MSLVKTEWSSIHIPRQLKERIKALKEREKRAEWEIVLDAIAYYETLKKKPKTKEEFPSLEKATWYITKLAMSVAYYLATSKDENYYLTLATIEETGKRLRVDMKILVEALTNYKNSKIKTPKKRATILKALKIIIREILSTQILEEKK